MYYEKKYLNLDKSLELDISDWNDAYKYTPKILHDFIDSIVKIDQTSIHFFNKNGKQHEVRVNIFDPKYRNHIIYGSTDYCLYKLFSSPLMHDTYEHLDTFQLSHDEWIDIFEHSIGESYSLIMDGNPKRSLESTEKYNQDFHNAVSQNAYELFSLLYDKYLLLDKESEIRDLIMNTDIQQNLLKLLSLSTSAKWPSVFHDMLSAEHEDQPACWIPEEVKKLCRKETPTIKPTCSIFRTDNNIFPPLNKETSRDENHTARSYYMFFVEKSLSKIDKVSKFYGRGSRITKLNEIDTNSCIFLQARHWQVIIQILFGIYPEERTINKLLQRQRTK